MTPEISVVIPTHNRAHKLPQTLGALERQTAAPEAYEVIVVADGCTDATAQVVSALWPSRRDALRLIERPSRGPAAARNRGAAQARASLVLFLDDDMEAAPGLVEAHLKAHAAQPGGVVLGHFPIAEPAGTESVFSNWRRAWWTQHFAEQARPGHRFTYRDFCTGNVSLPRAVFDAAGGLDEAIRNPGCEDWELGVRLVRLGIRFRYCPAAFSWHRDETKPRRAIQRSSFDGRAQVQMIRRHPELALTLPLSYPIAGPVLTPLWYLIWEWPWAANVIAGLIRPMLWLADRLRRRALWERIYGSLVGHAYWSGIRAELGSRAAWQALLKHAHAVRPVFREQVIDLAKGPAELASVLAAQPTDGLRFQYGDNPVGRMEAVPGAETLRPEHVLDFMRRRFDAHELEPHELEPAQPGEPVAE